MKAFLAVPLIALAACTANGNAIANYPGLGEVFSFNGKDYRVTDRPDLGSMMVTQSFADAAVPIAGLAGVSIPTGKNVAAAFIAPRGCEVTSADGILGSVEVTYAC